MAPTRALIQGPCPLGLPEVAHIIVEPALHHPKTEAQPPFNGTLWYGRHRGHSPGPC